MCIVWVESHDIIRMMKRIKQQEETGRRIRTGKWCEWVKDIFSLTLIVAIIIFVIVLVLTY